MRLIPPACLSSFAKQALNLYYCQDHQPSTRRPWKSWLQTSRHHNPGAGPSIICRRRTTAKPSLLASSRHSDYRSAVQNPKATFIRSMLELGVTDFVTPPFTRANVLPRVWHLLKQNESNSGGNTLLKESVALTRNGLIGESTSFLGRSENFVCWPDVMSRS